MVYTNIFCDFTSIIIGDWMNGLIGNTPMIKIYYRYLGKKRFLYTKLEFYNLTGSIKDRIVYEMLKKAKKNGKLKEGVPIVEATSGNTGISLAAIGAYFHHPVIIYMPNWVSKERMLLMKSYGAEVHLISKEEGGFQKCIECAMREVELNGAYYLSQFSNSDNWQAHYETTAEEIIKVIENVGGFVSGIGSGGTLMGIGKRLKKQNADTIIAALEPDTLPLLSTGNCLGSHKIEGIGDEFVPAIVDRSVIDQVYLIHDSDAINMSRKLASELGLGVGISSGANFLAAVLLEEEIGTNIVTVFPDDNKKYLSTDLVLDLEDNQTFLSNRIELLSYEIVEK